MELRLIIYLVLASSLIVIGTLRFQRLSLAARLLMGLAAFTLVLEIFTRIAILQGIDTAQFYHFFFLVEFCLTSVIFYHAGLKDIPWGRRLVLIGPVIFAVFFFFNLTSLQPATEFPSNLILVSCCYYLTLSLFIYHYMLVHRDTIPLHHQFRFWFYIGTSVFYQFTLLFFGLGFSQIQKFFPMIANTVYVANLMMYACYGLAVLLDRKLPILNQPNHEQ